MVKKYPLNIKPIIKNEKAWFTMVKPTFDVPFPDILELCTNVTYTNGKKFGDIIIIIMARPGSFCTLFLIPEGQTSEGQVASPTINP